MSNETHAEPNPYQSPSVDIGETVVVGSTAIEGLTVALVKRRELYRRVRLSGVLEAELEWSGDWPIEYVRVNGQTVMSKFGFPYVPQFAFDLKSPAGDVFHTIVDVQLWPKIFPFAVRAFRITVGDTVVYSEGPW